MKEFICIVCPNGCKLSVREENGRILVNGNRCKKGEQFAAAEVTHPMRTISSTVRTSFPGVPVLPVRVSGEIPKDMIVPVMGEINKVCVTEPVGRGDAVIQNVLGLNVDVIATSDRLLRKL